MQTADSLKYSCNVSEKSQILRELSVSIEPSSIKNYIESSLNRLQKTTALKGFRKGKVPMSMIRQYFMSDVKADVVQKVVSDSFWQAVRDKNITPVGAPEISDIKNVELDEAKNVTYVAKVEVFPVIKLAEISKLKAKVYSATMSDDDIKKTLENLQQNHAEVQSAEGDKAYDRPAKLDDVVDMSFEGTVNGQGHDRLRGQNQIVKVGGKRFMQEIEDGLVGMKKGETKKVVVKFPENFPDDMVAGKNVDFQITLHEIKKVVLPAVDDEFAKRFGVQTAAELNEKIRKSLEEEKNTEAKSKSKDSLIRALIDAHSFEVPKALLDAELRQMQDDFSQNLGRQGFTDKMIQTELKNRLSELESGALNRVKAFLLLDRLAEENKIDATDKDFDHEFTELSKNIGASPEQVRQFYQSNEDAMRRLKYRIKEDRVVDFLRGKMKIEEETLA